MAASNDQAWNPWQYVACLPGQRDIEQMEGGEVRVVPMAVGWPIKGVDHCAKGTASYPLYLSGMGEKMVWMPY